MSAEAKNNPHALEDRFEKFISTFHGAILGTIRREAFKCHLNMSQVEVLRYVTERGNPTMKEVAEYIHIKPPSVTSIVESLSKSGLLHRQPDKKDSRIVRVSITPKASRVIANMREKKKEEIKKMFAKLPQSDRGEFARILQVLDD